ncbi:hypothetical protein H4Q26_008309 [Puccinia striiformis f. sp. tritici PST-130]|nr:hypothetical protein H4Q26_008309 [Puccinia striiformis f. sp. tritici PST-130]
MTGPVSLCHSPSFDYPVPYPSQLQSTTLTELSIRGQMPSGCKHTQGTPSRSSPDFPLSSRPLSGDDSARPKQGDQSLLKSKSPMSATMNKSEPNLTNPGCASLPSTVTASYDIPLSSRSMGPSNTLRPDHLSTSGKTNQADARISEFTSRLNGPSPSSQSGDASGPSLPETMPPVLRSPVIVNATQRNLARPKPEAVPQVILAPLQRTSHHQDGPPVISQTSPPADQRQITHKIKRSNARVHSPNFYQSLKSRWKPDSLPVEDLFATISSVPAPFSNHSKTYSNFDHLKLELENPHFSTAGPRIDCRTAQFSEGNKLAESSSSRSVAEDDKGCSEGKTLSTVSDRDHHHKSEMNSGSTPAASGSGLRTFSSTSPTSRLPCLSMESQPSTAMHSGEFASQSSTEPNSAEVLPSDPELPNPDGPAIASVHPIALSHRNPSLDSCSVFHKSAGFAAPFAFPAPLGKLPPLPSTVTEPAWIRAEYDDAASNTPLIRPTPEASHRSQDCTLTPNLAELEASHPTPQANCCHTTSSDVDHPSSRFDQMQPSVPPANKPEPMASTELNNSEPLTIAEGLHHKHHLNFASRRSSISMVLKRHDSLDSSTPVLFQGIWEKELEENERKWKRLARMSGSQSSSQYSTESYTEKENASKVHGDRASFITGGPLRNSSSITSEQLIRLGRNLSQRQADNPHKSQPQSDVLDQVWDSFKCEAELSLSDISCETSITDDSPGNPACAIDLPALHQITFNNKIFDHPQTVQNSEILARQDAKPIGLGLIHPCDSSNESFPQDEYSPITNAKLKKLSLLSNRNPTGSLGGLRERRRRPESKVTANLFDTNHPKPTATPASLDLSLLDAFPVPPRSHTSSHSSSSSQSLKALALNSTDLPRRNPVDLDTTPADVAAGALDITKDRPSLKRMGTHYRHKSTTDSSAKSTISFTLRSFSNRPRAQTSARSPVPPPLNLNAAPLVNPNHRRRTMTSHFKTHSNCGPETIPPVPLLHVPNTAPLASTTPMSFDRERTARAAPSPDVNRPSVLNETKGFKIGTGGPEITASGWDSNGSVPVGRYESLTKFHSSVFSRYFLSYCPIPPHMNQQPANSIHHSMEQAGYSSSPHASVGSSTGTASTSSTVPSPATPTSLRMTYNSRIPSVPMYHATGFSSGLKSPIKSTQSDNPRYVMIDQTPKYSGGARVAPDTIKASRIYRTELLNSSALSEPIAQLLAVEIFRHT